MNGIANEAQQSAIGGVDIEEDTTIWLDGQKPKHNNHNSQITQPHRNIYALCQIQIGSV